MANPDASQAQPPAPEATPLQPGGSRGWPAGQAPGIVVVSNNNNQGNPNHVTTQYSVKEGDRAYELKRIAWLASHHYITGDNAFALRNVGDVTLNVNP